MAVSTVAYREIEGFPGYRVGDDGTPWSCLSGTWRKLRPAKDRGGYLHVILRRNGQSFHKMVHQLVLTAFRGPCPPGMEACHDDGNPANNRLDNLRWDTPKNNAADSVRHGTAARGERHGNAKLTDALVAIAKQRLRNGETQQKIADDLGVSKPTICRIHKGKQWRHVA